VSSVLTTAPHKITHGCRFHVRAVFIWTVIWLSLGQFTLVGYWFIWIYVSQGCHDSLLTWSDSYLQRVIGLPLSLVILTQVSTMKWQKIYCFVAIHKSRKSLKSIFSDFFGYFTEPITWHRHRFLSCPLDGRRRRSWYLVRRWTQLVQAHVSCWRDANH
jgi:hypothetical protein